MEINAWLPIGARLAWSRWSGRTGSRLPFECSNPGQGEAMQVPLQIAFRDVGQSEALAADIRKQATRLDRYCDHIMSCRVTLGTVAAHKQQGKLYEVHVDLRVPGDELVSTQKHANEDAYVAIRDAFEAAQRQLEAYVGRRSKGKRHEKA
jgi:ribosomal subunit interface protein